MKIRLPRLLLASLLAAMLAAPVGAAVRHTDVSLQTYVDFATNSGRYAVGGQVNAMLDYLRTRDEGVKIEYTGGQSAYTLPHEMISFDSVADMGNVTAVGYNYIVTVAHNSNQLYPTFTGNDYGIGAEKSIKYVTVDEDYDTLTQKTFVHHIYSGDNDYKVARLTKLVTDVTPAQMTGGAGSDYKDELVYRVGGGLNYLRDDKGDSDLSQQGVYLVGGIAGITGWESSTGDLRHGYVTGTSDWTPGKGAGEGTPLPFGSEKGDSGSPYFVWEGDDETGSYKFLMAHRGSLNNNKNTQGCEALEWTQNIMQQDSFCVDMGKVKGALKIQGAEVDAVDGPVWSDTYKTEVYNAELDAFVEVEQKFDVRVAQAFLADDDNDGPVLDKNWNSYLLAVETGQHTWKTLSDLKNKDTWYAYGNEYLNAKESVTLDKDSKPVVTEGLTYAKLFKTQNLVLEAAADGASYQVEVTKDTDLGAGYLHFAANGKKNVQFELKSQNNNLLLLNSAGYVVDEEVQVNVTLRNADALYMREWRKVGEGTLNICGEGKNEIFLNVGGKGETLLNQKDGYAAYNVLANAGSTVRIKDTSQIYRDFTFGNGGATLDMNGNSMDWYLTKGEDHGGFTINALTEEAIISNSSATKAVLTFREEKNQKFVGSFQDSATSALGIVYDGEGTWELNSIRTQLKHADSGLTVMSGTVKLAGTPTVHGYGTVHTEFTADFSTRADDWHYADATMNVTVANGATFELASHARLTGDVTVQTGGTYIMREGVNHAEEYIEGGENKESTGGEVANYYGHKGDVILEDGAVMKVQYTAGTDTATTYADDVTGPGKLVIDLGTDAAAFNMTGQISGLQQLDVQDKSRLNLQNMQDVAKTAISGEGSMVLQNGDKDLLKVETVQESAPATLSNLSLSSTSPSEAKIAGANGQTGQVQSAQLSVLANTTLVLEHVVLADDVKLVLAGAGARVLVDQAEFSLTATNTVGTEEGVASAITLKGCGISDQLRLEAGDKIYSMISNALVGAITVQGSSLLVDMTALGDMNGYDAVKLSFGQITSVLAMAAAAESENTKFGDLSAMSVTALMQDGKTWNGFYSSQDSSSVYFAYLPEPTTTTLSLLALAALCARRRRKMA